MKLLFITRKYPPSVGGMEKVSFDLSNELSKKVPTKIIAWGGSQKWLPWFITKAFFQSVYYIPRYKITNVHLGDGLLAPLGLLLKFITGVKTTVTVHGLDITFKNKIYQAVIPPALGRLNKVICVSEATQKECIKRGIPKSKTTIIPWGVYPNEFKVIATREDLEKLVGMDLKDKKVLITVGRLVKRKGVAWFVKNVMPILGQNYIYLVVGTGPELDDIKEEISANDLEKRVKLLGKVSDNNLKILYNTADVFVMPNIPIKGDIEGFGIVAVEASSAGLPIVAAELEGIKDAVLPKRTGLFFEPNDSYSSVNAILNVPKDRKFITENTSNNFTWDKVTNKYLKLAK
jgi:glycosyltransferase involved in cell wall biosynthesis